MGTDSLIYPRNVLILWPKPPKIKPASPPTFLAVDTSDPLLSLDSIFFKCRIIADYLPNILDAEV